jgi:hypothetical protein
MRTAQQPSRGVLLFLCAALLLSGCFETLNYRHIQDDFNAAVAADNEVSTVPTADPVGVLTSGDAQQRYQEIAARLSDKDIDRLDKRLQPNAYALRAVAQWRCGKLIEARNSATKGLALDNVANSPRDQMVLKIIPALVIDKELVAKFRAAGRAVNEATYNITYPKDFATAAQILKDATNAAQPATPDAVIFYVHLQRWRVLQNWRVVISMIDGGAPRGAEARTRAQDGAKTLLGGQSLLTEISSEEALVPANDPIRKAMEALALQ